jgi:hypothetical protein
MPYKERMMYPSYVENRDYIDSKWDKNFGDRMNELVIIGQDLNKDQIVMELESCLLDSYELADYLNGESFKDNWPI